MVLDLRRTLQELQHELLDERAEPDEEHSASGRNEERPAEDSDEFPLVAGSESLRRQPARAEPEKPEPPVDEAEDQRADGDGADEVGLRQPADHRRVDNADERLGHVRQHDRDGDGEDPPVGDVRPCGWHALSL